MVNAYEQALKPKPGEVNHETGRVDTTGMTPAQAKFAKRMAAKSNGNGQPIKGGMAGVTGGPPAPDGGENDPVAVLEK